MRRLCIPLWLKDLTKLKNLIDKVAKTEYRIAGDEFGKASRAEKTAVWYIALGKRNILATLYKSEPAHRKVYELLLNNFEESRWKSAAEKNAMVLVSKKNYMLSIAFFLLAKNVENAVQVAVDRIHDVMLAIVICRLMEGDDSPNLKKIYQEQFVQRGANFNDPWLMNIGKWQAKEYIESLNIMGVKDGEQH